MKKYDPSRRKFMFRDIPASIAGLFSIPRLVVGLGTAGLGAALTSGCDEEDNSQPATVPRAAALLENYPAFLKNENGVLDYTLVPGLDYADFDASLKIAQGIQRLTEGLAIETKLPDEVTLDQNLILVGRPAYLTYSGGDNPRLTDLVNIDPTAVPQLFVGDGLIKIHDYGNFKHLIVTGYGPDQIRNCGTVLNQPENYGLTGNEIFIKGLLDQFTIGNPPTDQ